MAKEKNEKIIHPSEQKRKKTKKNMPNKSKKGFSNKKQVQKGNSVKKAQEPKPKKNKTPKKPDVNVRIAFLGGLNEVGKNLNSEEEYIEKEDILLCDLDSGYMKVYYVLYVCYYLKCHIL